MSIFYEEELISSEKPIKVDGRRKPRTKDIVKVRYNNGGNFKTIIITIPLFIANKTGIKNGDKLRVTVAEDNQTIILKPFSHTNSKT